MTQWRHFNKTMKLLVFQHAAVWFLSFPQVSTGFVRMGKKAETPIWCARKKYLETSSGSDDLQEVTRLVWSLKAQNLIFHLLQIFGHF